jgi:ferredoxin-type protein NapH
MSADEKKGVNPAGASETEKTANASAGANASTGDAKKKTKKKRSGLSTLRAWSPVLVILVCSIAFVANVPLGNISSFGWESISAICPVGSLSILLASKTFVPRALISLVLAIVLILVFGRAFCSWVCTVPLVQSILGIRSQSKADLRRARAARERKSKAKAKTKAKGVSAESSVPAESAAEVPSSAESPATTALSEQERSEILAETKQAVKEAKRNHLIDSRHIILGGSLLSALVFGFPVFCLICPIGLSFAFIYLILRLFSGQVSWALIVVPVMLAAELLIFRRWCYRICPVSALMSLVARGNRTFAPHVDASKCIETAKGKRCHACNDVCPEGIDLHDYAKGTFDVAECIKCRKCADACPTKAIAFPLLPPKDGWAGSGIYGPHPKTDEKGAGLALEGADASVKAVQAGEL